MGTLMFPAKVLLIEVRSMTRGLLNNLKETGGGTKAADNMVLLTPSLPDSVKFLGWKHLQTVYF